MVYNYVHYAWHCHRGCGPRGCGHILTTTSTNSPFCKMTISNSVLPLQANQCNYTIRNRIIKQVYTDQTYVQLWDPRCHGYWYQHHTPLVSVHTSYDWRGQRILLSLGWVTSLTSLANPFLAARCKGVIPIRSITFTMEPFFSKNNKDS